MPNGVGKAAAVRASPLLSTRLRPAAVPSQPWRTRMSIPATSIGLGGSSPRRKSWSIPSRSGRTDAARSAASASTSPSPRAGSTNARRFADDEPDPFWAAIHAARLHLAERDKAKAGTILATAVPRCVRHEVIVGLFKARSIERERDVPRFLPAASLSPKSPTSYSSP